jgi:hypothetical protein
MSPIDFCLLRLTDPGDMNKYAYRNKNKKKENRKNKFSGNEI